jgi:parallel beta-helix repeat protein
MYWAGNQFFSNIVYGLDPHDGSSHFIVMYNEFHHNGRRGLIFSKGSSDNLIAYNTSFGNGLQGIMLDRDSDNNWLVKNEVWDNTDGIVVFESNANLVEGNEVSGSRVWGISLDGGGQNVVARNTVKGSGEAGLSVEGETATVLAANRLDGNGYGARVRRCSGCRLVANAAVIPQDATIKVDEASRLQVEDQAPGEVDLRDTASLVVLIDHSGQVLSLPRHAPSFSSVGGTGLQVQALTPGARVTYDRTNLQLTATTPVAVRVAEESNMVWTVAGREGFGQRVFGLETGRVYEVLVDGALYQRVEADDAGTAEFRYDGDLSEPKTFELRPA